MINTKIRLDMKNLTRICIYPKDIQIMLGKSYTSSCDLLKKIKKELKKKPHQIVTIEEFTRYMGLSEKDLKKLQE